MLAKSIILLAVAIVASASSSPDRPPQDPILGDPVCAECIPCATDCVCSDDHQSSCRKTKPFFPPLDPDGRPVCAEGHPCKKTCVCSNALRGRGPPHVIDGKVVCPEGQPCGPDCVCSFASLLNYINPSKLRGATRICDEGKCTDSCICREDILESVKDALFPPNGTKVIDYIPGDKNADEKGKDEL